MTKLRAAGVLVLLAACAAMLPMPAALVEDWYSTGVYLAWQTRVTPLTSAVPTSLFDLFVVFAGASWLATIGIAIARHRGGRLRAAARAAFWTLAWASAVYLLFLLSWGLNYRRVPLAEKLRFDQTRVTRDAASTLARLAAQRANMLYSAAHEALDAAPAEPSPSLAAGFARAQRDLGARRLAIPARAKRTLVDLYFRRAAVSGMIDPFFLETLIVSDLLPFERPFVVAHEWSHLAGYADESEASFVGWLTCLRGDVAAQYSGWLFLFEELLRSLKGSDRRDALAHLAPGPRADIEASNERIRRDVSPRVSAAGWRVYDRYLKANRVEAGAASYGLVVRLALGAEFDDGWVPRLR